MTEVITRTPLDPLSMSATQEGRRRSARRAFDEEDTRPAKKAKTDDAPSKPVKQANGRKTAPTSKKAKACEFSRLRHLNKLQPTSVFDTNNVAQHTTRTRMAFNFLGQNRRKPPPNPPLKPNHPQHKKLKIMVQINSQSVVDRERPHWRLQMMSLDKPHRRREDLLGSLERTSKHSQISNPVKSRTEPPTLMSSESPRHLQAEIYACKRRGPPPKLRSRLPIRP